MNCPFVAFHRSLLVECFAAHLTFVGSFTRVNSRMELKCIFSRHDLSTYLTCPANKSWKYRRRIMLRRLSGSVFMIKVFSVVCVHTINHTKHTLTMSMHWSDRIYILVIISCHLTTKYRYSLTLNTKGSLKVFIILPNNRYCSILNVCLGVGD